METIFHFEDGKDNFDNHCKENGFTYWSALDLMEHLGYSSWTSFNKVISKAMTTCNTLNIPIVDNFVQIQTSVDGKNVLDFKLSRFACYLIAMNGDVKNPIVAQAQAYFATIAGAIQSYQIEAERVERLQVRAEVSDREQSLSGVVASRGVVNYAFFQNARYRGLYNRTISQLKSTRNIPANRSLLDFMGKDELAANLFAITQTEVKIKEQNVRGQGALEATAENVGRAVRKTMIEISGVPPEGFKVEEDVNLVKKGLKATKKKLADKPRKK